MHQHAVIEGKQMRILAIGDVTSPRGLAHLEKNLWKIRKAHEIDFCVVNGENASFISGIDGEGATVLLRAGADAITGGNHTLRARGINTALEECPELLRPINYGDVAAGRGYGIYNASGYRVLVINAMGIVNIEPRLDSPYPYVDRLLADLSGRYDVSILDLHAEATGEKVAFGYAYDGKINVIFGTHTHVPTADEQILPSGTGYITDVGMCGESGGVLGMDVASTVEKMRTRLPIRFKAALGEPKANGVIFDYDMAKKRVVAVERVNF